MSRFILRLFCVTLLLSAVHASPSRSELVHGFFKLGYSTIYDVCINAFDFSTQTRVGPSSDKADLCYEQSVNTNYQVWWPLHGTTITASLSPLEGISVAPEGPYLYFDESLLLGRTYVLLTGDGLYAKLAVRGINFEGFNVTFEYYVQMDGTRNLDTVLPVEPTTWGQVKALYR
ncbi:MAG: hypothetical protein IH969_04820 [Candidatus Krumholzibacteriota bacterium]|nr:hypothetical protein [Candidatus Krumholzibacteriota bacterium]